ncbi:Cyclase-associated protein 1-like protein [Drosera capensis]
MDEKLIQRLENAVSRLEALSAGGGGGGVPRGLPAEDVADPASDPAIDLDAIRHCSLFTGPCLQKPNMDGLAQFLQPLNEVITKAKALTEGRRSDFFNHQKTIADSLSALAWVAYAGKDCGTFEPSDFTCRRNWQMAEFYNNKVLVQYRSKDPNHAEWAKALKELYIPGLRDYVKGFYPLGPVWGTGAKTSVPAPRKAPAPGGPAPPPPPPAPIFSSDSLQASSSSSSSSRPKEGLAAVFQEISSANITAGLRKVTDDMKSKNRKDRTGVVTTAKKEESVGGQLKIKLGRKIWLLMTVLPSSQFMSLDVRILYCKSKGVAVCEIVNCNRVEVQSQGSAPTISVDNTAGCQLYLSNESLEASITAAKSSEINVLVPASETEGDCGEHALPEQFVHLYKDGQFVTTPISHSGG